MPRVRISARNSVLPSGRASSFASMHGSLITPHGALAAHLCPSQRLVPSPLTPYASTAGGHIVVRSEWLGMVVYARSPGLTFVGNLLCWHALGRHKPPSGFRRIIDNRTHEQPPFSLEPSIFSCGCRIMKAARNRIETSVVWPSRCRSTPEQDELQAPLSALMTDRVASGVPQHLLPIDAGRSVASTFIRPRKERERHLECASPMSKLPAEVGRCSERSPRLTPTSQR